MSMPKDRKTASQGAIVASATLRLDEAVTELDATLERQNLIQKRANTLAKQIDTLLQTQTRIWTATTHDKLLAAQARFAREQKFLDKARRSVAKAQIACDAALDRYTDAFDRQSAAHVELRSALEGRHRQNAALCRALQNLFDRRWMAVWQEHEQGGHALGFDMPGGSHDYIPLDIPRFLDLLTHLDRHLSADPAYTDPDGAARYRPVSFLEVGCGSGRNLLLARACGLCLLGQTAGFDINPVSVEIGKRTFGLNDDLFVGDALDHDYGGFDVIYSFRPFSDNTLQTRYEARLAATMRDGAYLLAPLSHDLGLYPDLAPVGQTPDIWQKRG